MNKIALVLIKFYQKCLTVLAFGSCRYYPSCSQYAKIQFEKNSFFKALYYSILRILKCNQLFEGGFDYPIVKITNIENRTIRGLSPDEIKYWLIPKEKDRYYLIKKFNRK
jgi:putative membrane protein insertion efficiency factor